MHYAKFILVNIHSPRNLCMGEQGLKNLHPFSIKFLKITLTNVIVRSEAI